VNGKVFQIWVNQQISYIYNLDWRYINIEKKCPQNFFIRWIFWISAGIFFVVLPGILIILAAGPFVEYTASSEYFFSTDMIST